MRLADFGFTEGINEIIAITRKADGSLNTAPIGIIVEDCSSRMARVRLYRSHTRENVEREGRLFANVIWDAVIFALASFDDLGPEYFESINPPVIKGAMAWCEFSARLEGGYAVLELVDGEVLQRQFRAVNRGFNAVIEALVHATRFVAIKDEAKKAELKNRIVYYSEIARKCGSEKEKNAFKIILEKI
ncbi:DUF447 domain-containing protein [Archaeoglobus neptunius]|uniref:DUF447 domain-containing protein n=1 Tax=Archaeoglobus neptunius TaxID=2798580 RepID=UPI0019265E40